ncbi:hypothetical protein [Streptomyces sp. GMR22]|uniref:hypothetical protein n=1 Tax=Streptomyces sp. GMR22 TaxID=2759524 RepID=UPI0015F99395|nr:hypothetical protein [Streptomyces sp. GMR22]MBA6434279.1 hypothetical protein [Streptomyces sp. GMR22]
MSSVLANILIGLITSLISGLSVWLWQRAKSVRAGRRQAAFFGISPGQSGLVILTHHHSSPWVTSHYDVYALLEAAALVDQVRGEIAVEAASEFRGSNGNRTELCIGGPDANERSAGHLAYHLPGIRFLPFRHHYQELMKTLPSIDRFCLIVRVSLPNVYGHELVELERDVTAEAFAP